MSGAFDVSAGEHGTVRVFALSMSPDEIAAIGTPGGVSMGALLGAEGLDPERVEIVATADLTGLGLAHYLTEGIGLHPEEVAADRPRLDALGGHVALLPASALGGQAQVLTPRPEARLIGLYHEIEGRPASPEALPRAKPGEAEAPPETAPSPAPDRGRRGWLIALVVLLGLAAIGMGLAR